MGSSPSARAKHRAQAAKALAAAGAAAPCLPGLSLGERWCLQAWEGAWSPQRSGPEGWGSGGAKCSRFGRVWRSRADRGRVSQRSPSVFSSVLYLVVTYQFCLSESTGCQEQGQPRFTPHIQFRLHSNGGRQVFKCYKLQGIIFPVSECPLAARCRLRPTCRARHPSANSCSRGTTPVPWDTPACEVPSVASPGLLQEPDSCRRFHLPGTTP